MPVGATEVITGSLTMPTMPGLQLPTAGGPSGVPHIVAASHSAATHHQLSAPAGLHFPGSQHSQHGHPLIASDAVVTAGMPSSSTSKKEKPNHIAIFNGSRRVYSVFKSAGGQMMFSTSHRPVYQLPPGAPAMEQVTLFDPADPAHTFESHRKSPIIIRRDLFVADHDSFLVLCVTYDRHDGSQPDQRAANEGKTRRQH